MKEDPILIILTSLICLYFFIQWCKDLKRNRNGSSVEEPFLPGAYPAPNKLLKIAVVGSLILLFLETAGEYWFGISEEQSEISLLFLCMIISASFIEEVIFRGYLFANPKNKMKLWISIFLFSILFAIFHPYFWLRNEEFSFWEIHKGAWNINLSTKGLFSTFFIFTNSIWFYCVRFSSLNIQNSLLPSILAHLTKNIGVFIIKAIEGKVNWF